MIMSSSDSMFSVLSAAMKSMTNEFISIIVFFATWVLVNKFLRKKSQSKADVVPSRRTQS